jgi:hypothetical protein
MSVTYTNRKGRKYYLCQGVTKTGKPRYFFSREQKGKPIKEMPKGYEITESVNGIVSLSKARPKLLMKSEIATIEFAIQTHRKARKYRFDVKSKEVIIYEQVGPDLEELSEQIETEYGFSGALTNNLLHQFENERKIYTQYTPVMKFILTDKDKRLFCAQRMCYLGGIDDWMDLTYDKTIEELSNTLIPTLGTDEFFELY